MKKMITLMLGIFLLTNAEATVYVVPGGSGDGSSWASALGDIQSAVNAAQVLFSTTTTPDLRFYDGPADEEYDTSGKRTERSIYARSWIDSPSKESTITLTIQGYWNLPESDYFSTEVQTDGTTKIIVKTKHGLSREIRLSP